MATLKLRSSAPTDYNYDIYEGLKIYEVFF